MCSLVQVDSGHMTGPVLGAELDTEHGEKAPGWPVEAGGWRAELARGAVSLTSNHRSGQPHVHHGHTKPRTLPRRLLLGDTEEVSRVAPSRCCCSRPRPHWALTAAQSSLPRQAARLPAQHPAGVWADPSPEAPSQAGAAALVHSLPDR